MMEKGYGRRVNNQSRKVCFKSVLETGVVMVPVLVFCLFAVFQSR